MKQLLTIFSLAFIYTTSTAQIASTKNDFKAAWGAEYEFPKKHEDLGFWKGTHGGYLNISIEVKKSLVIQRFDSKMKFMKDETIDLSGFPSNFDNEGIWKLGNRFFWFYSLWDKPKAKEQLYVQELDVDAGKLIGTARKIIEAEKLSGDMVNRGWYNIQVTNKFKFSPSLKKDMLLITYRYPPLDKDDSKNYDRMGWQVFDSSVEKVWGNDKVKMPYTEEMMDNEDYMVDSKGTVYLLASVRELKWKELKKQKKGYQHFEVLRLDEKSGSFTKIEIRPGSRWVRQVLLAEDPTGGIFVTGFYSNNEHSYGSNGIFIMKIDPETGAVKELKKGFYEFPAEMLRQFESERTKKKLEKKEKKAKEDDEDGGLEASNLVMRNVELSDDGSILLNAEEYMVIAHTSTDSRGMSRTYYTYHYNDIIAMKINADGELGWMYKIPKRQRGASGRGGLGFVQFTMNGNHYYFYLDNIKNLNLSKDQEPAEHVDGAGGFLVYTKIDPDGKLSKGQIMDLRQEEVRIYGSEFKRVDETQIVTRAQVKKMSKILSLTLNESKK